MFILNCEFIRLEQIRDGQEWLYNNWTTGLACIGICWSSGVLIFRGKRATQSKVTISTCSFNFVSFMPSRLIVANSENWPLNQSFLLRIHLHELHEACHHLLDTESAQQNQEPPNLHKDPLILPLLLITSMYYFAVLSKKFKWYMYVQQCINKTWWTLQLKI